MTSLASVAANLHFGAAASAPYYLQTITHVGDKVKLTINFHAETVGYVHGLEIPEPE